MTSPETNKSIVIDPTLRHKTVDFESVDQVISVVDQLQAPSLGKRLSTMDQQTREVQGRMIAEGSHYRVLDSERFSLTEADLFPGAEPAGEFTLLATYPSKQYESTGTPLGGAKYVTLDPLTAKHGEPYILVGNSPDITVVSRFNQPQADGTNRSIYRVGTGVDYTETAIWYMGGNDETSFLTVQTVEEMEPGMNFGTQLGVWAEQSNAAERSRAVDALLRLAQIEA
jgi:hypothetical protein